MGGSNKFLDGVFWGLLIGGCAVFLFGTKKGNKILKIITEEGTLGLNKVLKDIEEAVEDETSETLPDTLDEKPREEKKEEINSFSDNHFEDIEKVSEKPASQRGEPKVKRFFRSSKK